MPVDPTPVVTQSSLEMSANVTPDTFGSFLDVVISNLQLLNPSPGTWLAIIVAGLVVARMAWKKWKSSKSK